MAFENSFGHSVVAVLSDKCFPVPHLLFLTIVRNSKWGRTCVGSVSFSPPLSGTLCGLNDLEGSPSSDKHPCCCLFSNSLPTHFTVTTPVPLVCPIAASFELHFASSCIYLVTFPLFLCFSLLHWQLDCVLRPVQFFCSVALAASNVNSFSCCHNWSSIVWFTNSLLLLKPVAFWLVSF